jgi:hypothetical protein
LPRCSGARERLLGSIGPGARGALESFLLRFPASPRAGEASVMLGRLLLDGGDRAGARTRFRAALTDPSPRVKRAAAEALQSAGN